MRAAADSTPGLGVWSPVGAQESSSAVTNALAGKLLTLRSEESRTTRGFVARSRKPARQKPTAGSRMFAFPMRVIQCFITALSEDDPEPQSISPAVRVD